MKKLNLFGTLAVVALLFAGCEMSKEAVSLIPGETTVVATRDGIPTRSVLSVTEGEAPSYEILWSAPDKILVGYPGVTPATFTSTNTKKAASATFKGKLPSGEGDLIGIYPAVKGNKCDEDGVFSVDFLDEQEAVAGTYDPKAFPAVALGENNNLQFMNVCGLLELQVGYSDVTKITLVNGIWYDPVVPEDPDPGLGPEFAPQPLTRSLVLSEIPGGTLSVSVDGEPFIVEYSEGITSIVLNAPKSGYFSKEELYYMSVPPCDFPNGAVFLLERESGVKVEIKIEGPLAVERSTVHQVMPLFDENIPDDNIPGGDEPGGDEPGGDEPGDGIVIDGDMSDWAEVEGTVNKSGNILEVKGSADDDNVYVYVKRAKTGRWDELWGGDDGEVGYYYFDFDMDNNPSTGDNEEGSRGFFEGWCFLYIFGGTADEPVFRAHPTGGRKGMVYTNANCAGEVTDDAVIVEVSFPRADLPATTSNIITVTVWGNKDGSPATTATIKLGEGGDEPGGDEPGGDEPGGDEPGDGYTNLSAEGTANCYIVDAAGAYKFKAVKGNSDVSVGSVAEASLIWETYNNAEYPAKNSIIASVDVVDDFIVFETPDKLNPGNALIAAVDAAGTILWSWHIWIPATEVSSADYGIHPKAMMDRNLGALTVAQAGSSPIDIQSVGLVYQWGRKDPFPGPRGAEAEGGYDGFARVTGTEITKDKVLISLEESIQRPTFFARGTDDTDWLDEVDNTLWGDASDKTIYDPCPAGYRVPNREKKYALWSGADITSATGWSYDATNYWFTLGSPATVFPARGYCDGGSFKVTFRTCLWNAHADSDAGTSAYCEYVYAGPKGANYSHHKNRGYYVRCCVE